MPEGAAASAGSAAAGPIVSVRDLAVSFAGSEGVTQAVRDVDLAINPGETVALVGESGSGKSVTALSLLRLLPASARVTGAISVCGTDTVAANEEDLRAVRGGDVGMIFQEPMTSLNPLHTVAKQVGESLRVHQGLDSDAAQTRVLELLTMVGIREPENRLASYPHQLSGGQRQRVMIAMALANDPKLLIADEPTTALDVTIQAQILALLKTLQTERGMSMLFITHDLGVVRKVADRVAVMKDGQIVEQGQTAALFDAPEHPYTKLLLDAVPRGRPEPAPAEAPEVARLEDLRVWFPIRRGLLRRTVGHIKAVTDASLSVRAGETLGIVGESGSGKTTLALALLRLIKSEGRIVALGQTISDVGPSVLRPLRAEMQIVFQDPYGALSPRLPVAEIIAEGLDVHGLGPGIEAPTGEERRALIGAALEEVGLEAAMMDRYPHEFSGGQRQRIAIARAMILKPKLVVLDEPTSALDMTVQRQIVELLRGLQEKHGLAYVFISHDLKVVRAMAHRIVVMRGGEIVEQGEAEAVLDRPQTEYTKALMDAAFHILPSDAVAT